MLENFSTRTKFIFLGIMALILVVVIFLSLITSDNNNQAPTSTKFDNDAPCYIVGGEKLYEKMDSEQFMSLRKNLTQYAREYMKSSDPKIDYELVGGISGDSTSLEFDLKSLNTPKHEIVVNLKTLPNSRINILIKDKKTGNSDYSGSLDANSARNTFVSTLPVKGSGFIVDYDSTVDKLRITLSTRTEQSRNDALKFVSDKLKVDSLDDKDYTLIAPGYLDDFSGSIENDGPEGD